MSYLDAGFSEYFVRQNSEESQVKENEYQQELLQFGIPANNVVAGIMQSSNGKLTINLDSGELNYNDGTTDLLTIGGENNSVVINNDQSSSILSSITT